MYIIGKTRYLKNLKAELNSKKQITQIFLVIYGLLVPQLLSTIGITGNFTIKGCTVVYISIFLLTMLSYYQEVTKEVNLATLNISNINFHATIGAGAFNYFLFLYIFTSHGIQEISATGQSFIFLVFSIMALGLSFMLLDVFLIKTKREITINEEADELIKLRSNRIKNAIKEKFGINEDFSKYFTLTVSIYILYILLSAPFFVTFFKVSV